MNENNTLSAPCGFAPLPAETVSPIVLLICTEAYSFPKGVNLALFCAD